MNYRSIPRTNLNVSTICLGTMTFGNPVGPEDATRLVHWALDNGINFFDTADMYEGYDRKIGSAGGVGERILGEALRGRRDEAVVTTKVGSDVGGKGLGRDHVLRQIDAGLERLQTDHVDIYEMHRPDPQTPLAESIAIMAELIEAGKVRYWGFSNFDAAQIDEMVQLCDAHGWPRPVVSQPPYSWLKRDVEARHLPTCRRHGIAVTPYQPLQGGLLTGKYRRGRRPPRDSRAAENPDWLKLSQELYDDLERFEGEAQAAALAPSQYAIRWLLDKTGVVSVVVGAKRTAQLEELIAAV